MGDDKLVEDQSRSLVTSAKKLYSNIQDLGVQIDSLSARCLEVEDLFAHELQTKRLAIKDCCESLFNLSPKSYGAVAREKLWRMALYDAVNRARRIQRDRPWTQVQLDLVKAHLLGGVGVLQLYIMKLKGLCESETEPVSIRTDSIERWLEGDSLVAYQKPITHGQREKTWITDLVYLCIINIGDLFRYLKEMHAKAKDQDLIFDTNFYLTSAQTHYSQAFLLCPESGLAFNQLGNLYCDVSGSLQSAYYLLYSLQSVNAYEGAYSNLRQLLDRKIVQFARLPASVEPKPLDTLVNSILSLMYYFLYENTHLQNYERHCQEALTNFNERLVTCDPELDDKFLFHLSTICVMTVWRLQSIKSVHTSAAVAFSISVFCQLINHLSIILEQHARVRTETVENPVRISPSPLPSSDQASEAPSSRMGSVKPDEEDEVKQSDKENDLTEQNGFIVPKRRRRVRRVRGDSHSDSEMSDYGTPDFLCSDEEELERSEDESEEENWSEDEDFLNEKMSQRDGSEYSFKMDTGNKAFDSSSSNGHSETSGGGGANSQNKSSKTLNGPPPLLVEQAKQKYQLDLEDLAKFRSQVEATLVALNPFLRWIQASSVIKDALAANAEKTFLEKFCSVLNLLISHNWAGHLDDVSIPEIHQDWKLLCKGQKTEKEVFKWELDEDRSMLGIPQLKEFVDNLQIRATTADDAFVIRVGRMVAFGSWMVSTESFSVLYTPEELNFFVPSPQTLKAYLLESKLNRLKDKLGNRKLDGMDRLSKAYQEMKIRGSGGGSSSSARRNRGDRRRRRGDRGGRRRGTSGDPIYAVVDLAAVLHRFRDVKRVAAHRKFIVVIPNSVWKSLDILKDSEEDESANARGIFKWLEGAMNRQHPGFILHKDQHRLKINFPYPRDPVDAEAWDYYDMMEHCSYIMSTLQKQHGGRPRSTEVIWGDVRDKCRVFFLTGQESLLNTKIARSFDPVKIARNVGIYVDFIGPYPDIGSRGGRKWQKSVAKSNG